MALAQEIWRITTICLTSSIVWISWSHRAIAIFWVNIYQENLISISHYSDLVSWWPQNISKMALSQYSEYFWKGQSTIIKDVNITIIKQNFPFQPNIPCLFQVNTLKCFIFLSLSIFILVIIWIVFTMYVMYKTTTQEHGGIVMMTQ